MAYERLWPAALKPFTSNGTAQGTFQVSDSTGFYVKQTVALTSTALPAPFPLEIKRIDPNGTVHVGAPGDINNRMDISAYLVVNGASAFAPEQRIGGVKPDEIINAVYERDPIKAIRTIGVDSKGNFYSLTNPFPVVVTGGTDAFQWDDLDIASENANGDPTVINFYLASVLVATYTLTYLPNGNFQHLHKDFF